MGNRIRTAVVSVTTTGDNGSATGTGDSVALNGELLDIYLDYHASAPNTTDVTITELPRGTAILTVTDNATDGLYTPRAAPVNVSNSAISNAHDHLPLTGQVRVSVAGSNALTACVTAYIRYRS